MESMQAEIQSTREMVMKNSKMMSRLLRAFEMQAQQQGTAGSAPATNSNGEPNGESNGESNGEKVPRGRQQMFENVRSFHEQNLEADSRQREDSNVRPELKAEGLEDSDAVQEEATGKHASALGSSEGYDKRVLLEQILSTKRRHRSKHRRR